MRLSSMGIWYSVQIIAAMMPDDISMNRWTQLIVEECNRRVALGQHPLVLRLSGEPREHQHHHGRQLQNHPINIGVSGCSGSETPSSISRACSSDDLQVISVTDNSKASRNDDWCLPRMSRISWTKLSDEDLQAFHKNILIKRIHSLEGACKQYQQQLKRLKRAHRSQSTRDSALSVSISNPNDDDRALQISTGKVRLTKNGFVALGIRKALALSSAVAFPLAILMEVSRQTVCRAETSVWTMLVMRSAAFHKLMGDVFLRVVMMLKQKNMKSRVEPMESDTCQLPLLPLADVDYAAIAARDLGVPVPHSTDENQLGDVSFFVGGAAFSGDATNSGIWRRNKLQGLILTSAFAVHPSRLSSQDSWHHAFASHTTALSSCVHWCGGCELTREVTFLVLFGKKLQNFRAMFFSTFHSCMIHE